MKYLLTGISTALLMLLAPLPSAGASDTSVPTILYYANHTYYNRAVSDAANDWDLSSKVSFVRVPDCGNLHPCVDIYNNIDIDDAYAGLTQYFLVDGRDDLYWNIIISPAYGTGYVTRRSIFCHEFGHVLGVPHGKRCMREYMSIDKITSGWYNRSLITL
jgi:hypothetical protein